MNRLTRKTTVRDWIEDCEVCDITSTKPYATFEEFEKENPYQYILENLNENEELNKMGKFEDIMEEYEINGVEELENVLASKVVIGGIRSGGKSIVQKGMLYNKLSEELGCPLEVVIKALAKGIEYEIGITTYYSVNDTIPTKRLEKRKNIQEIKLKKYIDKFAFFVPYDYSRGGIVQNDIIYLKDYKKTWWLKGDKNE